jgi:hypothetical protein
VRLVAGVCKLKIRSRDQGRGPRPNNCHMQSDLDLQPCGNGDSILRFGDNPCLHHEGKIEAEAEAVCETGSNSVSTRYIVR